MVVDEDAGVSEVCASVMSGELAREVQVGVNYTDISAIGELSLQASRSLDDVTSHDVIFKGVQQSDCSCY